MFNEPYELPEGGVLEAELPSNLRDAAPRALAAGIADAVFAADCVEGGSINATEIFLYRDTVRVVNSRGIDKTQVKYRAMIEAIPTFTEGRIPSSCMRRTALPILTRLASRRRSQRRCRRFPCVAGRKACHAHDRPRRTAQQRDRRADVRAGRRLNYANVYAQGNLHKKGKPYRGIRPPATHSR